jgi:hypothetical protein
MTTSGARVTLLVLAIACAPAMASAQTDPCGAGERWTITPTDRSSTVTLTYASPVAQEVDRPPAHEGTVAWRVALPGAVELVMIGRSLHARCRDGTFRSVAAGDEPLEPLATTHVVLGLAWPDLVAHVRPPTGWSADVHFAYDGSRYVPTTDGVHCTFVRQPAAVLGELAWWMPPVAPGVWIDASAHHGYESFRVPLAADPSLVAIGLVDQSDAAVLLILAPEGSGHCVVGAWGWSFGGNGVDFGYRSETSGPPIQAVTRIGGAPATLVLLDATAHFHGGCGDEEACDPDVTDWLVLAVTREQVVDVGGQRDRTFRDVDRARVHFVETEAGAMLAAGARRWLVDPATGRLVARRTR